MDNMSNMKTKLEYPPRPKVVEQAYDAMRLALQRVMKEERRYGILSSARAAAVDDYVVCAEAYERVNKAWQSEWPEMQRSPAKTVNGATGMDNAEIKITELFDEHSPDCAAERDGFLRLYDEVARGILPKPDGYRDLNTSAYRTGRAEADPTSGRYRRLSGTEAGWHGAAGASAIYVFSFCETARQTAAVRTIYDTVVNAYGVGRDEQKNRNLGEWYRILAEATDLDFSSARERMEMEGVTTLHIAACCGDADTVGTSVVFAAAVMDARAVEASDGPEPLLRVGDTPLIAAARYGRTGAALTLLDLGADPSLCDMDGASPSDIAKREGYAELSSLLEEEAAKRRIGGVNEGGRHWAWKRGASDPTEDSYLGAPDEVKPPKR